jgi:hypothetical protein
MSSGMRLTTPFLLMAQYGGAAVVPLEAVRRDYFGHLTTQKLLQKILAGQIRLPVVRIEDSQKAARGVHLQDLADYIDQQREKALKEFRQIAIE